MIELVDARHQARALGATLEVVLPNNHYRFFSAPQQEVLFYNANTGTVKTFNPPRRMCSCTWTSLSPTSL